MGPESSLLLHRSFEAQAAHAPEQVAVICGSEQLTYRELNERANRLAHYLRTFGVGPEVLVALCMRRTLSAIVAAMAIVKAGGAYVPLDPTYPQERLTLMLQDCRARLLLTEEDLPPEVSQCVEQAIHLEQAAAAIASQPKADCASDVREENLAYVIYTSGSTGKPKGVMIEHRGAVTTIRDINQRFGISGQDRVLALSALGFDLSVYDIFGLLSTGGALVFVENSALREPGNWLQLMVRHGVTLWNTTPGTMQLLVEHLGMQLQPPLPSLRLVLLSGDWIPKTLPPQIKAVAPSAELVSLGGATEASIWSIFHPIVEIDPTLSSIPYGRPLTYQGVDVLDEELEQCAALVSGELYISGMGLARGYLYDEAKTRASFITHPRTGQRLYRTGDLGRYRPDGNIEFLGRLDQQIKVRGFRVELGEIESVLASHEVVNKCVVVTHRSAAGNASLIAYIVPSLCKQLSPTQLAELQGQHFAHMRMLYDATYTRDAADLDPSFNISGWISSYTGLPIPAAEMQEWVERTVDRIAALGPQRVLEIGCGTGLLLLRLAPGCQRYVGTDLSFEALRAVEQQLQNGPARLAQVALRHQDAAEFAGLQSEAFDTVVLNSVAQHFPDIEYLLAVVAGAVGVVRPGGRVFIGDLRSLPLLITYHTSVELYQASDQLSRGRMQRHVLQRAAQDEELLVDPAFFAALPRSLSRISRVQILHKRGRSHNELTRFRYDVVLHIDETVEPEAVYETLDWQERHLDLTGLRRLLTDGERGQRLVQNIPNARVRTEVLTQDWLFGASGPEQVGGWRSELAHRADAAVDPEAVRLMGEELSYAVDIYVSSTGRPGCFDAVLRPPGERPVNVEYRGPTRSLAAASSAWQQYANDPMQSAFVKGLVPVLRDYLRRKLPDYMVPSQFVLLSDLPLSSNGKIDRKRLPEPEQRSRSLPHQYVPPRTSLELVLARIWSDLLEIDQVGMHDNFFDLGGHSMLAAQVVSRIRGTLGVDSPLRWIFDEPTLAGLAANLERKRGQVQGAALPPVTSAPAERPAPISYDQQQVWLVVQQEPGSLLYNDPFTLRLSGVVQTAALSRSLDEIIRRHEMWRTTYRVVAGKPVQVVHPAASLALPVIDLRGRADREAEARRLAERDMQRPFDLETGPLLRAMLVHLADADHRLYLTLHHSIFDGASLYNVFLRELHILYHAFCTGKESPLPPLPLQYTDYAIWQRRWLTDEWMEPQIRYWKQQLAGLPVLELPVDYPRQTVSTYRGARHWVTVPRGTLTQLVALSHEEGVTLYMTLLAAFQTLLYRYTGQDDIPTGIVASRQDRSEVRGLLGIFVSSMLLRTDFSGAPSFRELLGRVRERVLLALSNKDVPLEKLMHILRPERRASKEPFIQTLFLLDPPVPALDSGWWLDRMELHNGTSSCGLSLQLDERPEGLRGFFEYSPDLFAPTTIAAMAGHFHTLLKALIANPGQQVGALELIAAEDRTTLQPKDTLSRRLALIESETHTAALSASQERGKKQKAASARHRLRAQQKEDVDG